MTYNNLGVLHKQRKREEVAIKYLKKVVEVEEKMTNSETQTLELAQSYINICSIYSEMRKHEISLSYAKKAVDILDTEYERRYPNNMGSETESQQFVGIVVSALYNAAVEYEYAEDFSSSLIHYSKALKMSKIHLGLQNPLTIGIENNFDQVKTRIRENPSLTAKKPLASLSNAGNATSIMHQRSSQKSRHSQ